MRANAFGVVLLLIAGFILVQHLPAWQDLEFGDETMYLGSGLHFSIPFAGGAQWGPLYAAWYAFWHLFIPDPLDLYYFNWAVLSVMAGVLVFLFFRSLQVPLWVSVWLGILFLFSSQNLPLNPKISIFPFCLILGALSVNQFYNHRFSGFMKFVIVALAGLLCAYARPEFYISFLAGSGVALFFFVRDRAYLRTLAWVTLTVYGITAFGLHELFGNPMFSGEGDRSAVAFQQHFVVNYCAWKGIPEPQTIEAQIKLFHRVLGKDVHSLTDALVSQPGWVVKHISSNLYHTVKGNVNNLIDTFFYTLFRGWYSPLRIVLYGGLIVLMLLIVDYRKTWAGLRSITSRESLGLLALVILILPAIVASILVYPRTHYLVFQIILLFWIIAFLINSLEFKGLKLPATKVSGFLATVGLISYVVFISFRYFAHRRPEPTPTADNVRYIMQLKPMEHLNILERHWYRVFLPYETTWVHVEDYNGNDFVRFVREKEVNFILMTADMQAYFASNEGFQDFMSRHVAEGFIKLPTNNQGAYLLVKNGVLE